MDNIDFRKKAGKLHGLSLCSMLITAAFVIGAVLLTLFFRTDINGVMSIAADAEASLWLCFAMLILAAALCVIMPAARVLTLVFSALSGAAAALISYFYSEVTIFSTEFFALCGVIFIFSAAFSCASENAFMLSVKLRELVRTDRRSRYELNLFCVLFAALMFAAIISAVLFTM